MVNKRFNKSAQSDVMRQAITDTKKINEINYKNIFTNLFYPKPTNY